MTCADPTAWAKRECSPPGKASEASPSARILRRRWTSGTRDENRELVDLLATRSPRELILATRVLRALFDELDGIKDEDE